ncbi:RidA family protein [Acetobacterium paludosum]|uniref:RidA family protein n=1 Tax=Acetobacterium paludosum TaxID=52693 RepID=A0A923HU52_9FIRM|nr:RidA family protein [Acetobacterium paludosum]MBC3887305.1 RidA family protein [Acetobacterium paludosum]
MNKKAVNSDQAPAAVGPYSHAYLAGETLYISGQLGLNPETGILEEGIEAQAERGLNNLAGILESASLSRKNIVKTVIFLTDMDDFVSVNAIYADFFKDQNDYPARSCVQVAALPKGALFEIEAIAVK